jgi:peptide/nickel transport system substrate-binding protein
MSIKKQCPGKTGPGRPSLGEDIGRREFLVVASALDLSAAAGTMLTTQSARAATPRQGGRLRQALRGGATSDSLDGASLLDTHNINTSWQVRNCLTEVTADGEVIGELAEGWEVSSDARQWVFKLRRGVEFHNGKTLDAEDVIYSINHHRGPDSKSGASGVVEGIEDIRADGKDTVVFTLRSGNADFPYLMSDYHLVVAIAGTEGPEWDKGIGTGPFILTEWEPGVRSAGRRNPNYFKDGRPYFDEVETLNIADATARIGALRTGEVDVIEDPDIKTVDRLAQVEGIKILEIAGDKHFTVPMRTDTPPFDNNDVRLALKYAVDRKALLQTVLQGHGYLGNDHPISKTQRYFASDLEQREYDPDKARFHLDKAGLSNLSVELYTAEIFGGAVDAAVLYKEFASKAGIDIEVKKVAADGYWSDIWMQKPWCMSYWQGRPTVDWMFSAGYAADATWNDTYWKNDRFNKLLLEARTELDDAKRREIYVEMQQILRDDGGNVIPIFGNYIIGASDKVQTPQKMAGNWSMDGDKNAERWWFE